MKEIETNIIQLIPSIIFYPIKKFTVANYLKEHLQTTLLHYKNDVMRSRRP